MQKLNAQEKLRVEKSYSSYVEAQAERNPSLSNLVEFLSFHQGPGWPANKACRILSLDFREGSAHPYAYDVKLDELYSLLRQDNLDLDGKRGNVSDTILLGRLLVIEDLNPALTEELGSYLDIDPLFFASHLHSPSFDTGTQLPDAATLPSRYRPQRFTNIHYHRTIVFHQDLIPTGTLIRDGNVPRKVAVLPRIKNSRIGLAQQCASVYKAECPEKPWIGTYAATNLLFSPANGMKV
jgi:hypothetical protein